MAEVRPWYDADRLLTDADMKEIAREIGIQIRSDTGARKNVSILCQIQSIKTGISETALSSRIIHMSVTPAEMEAMFFI